MNEWRKQHAGDLECYDAMTEAIRTGRLYQTILGLLPCEVRDANSTTKKKYGDKMMSKDTNDKPIIFTQHAIQRMRERGASEGAVREAIRNGDKELVKKGRILYRFNMEFNKHWDGRFFRVQQVAPVVVEEKDRIIVITVYTFYFQEAKEI